jgi:formate hydrogenlyase subunit 3/multisubunit Na+/H+ antiporter MnhD subunit
MRRLTPSASALVVHKGGAESMGATFARMLAFHWSTTFLLMGVFSVLGAAATFNIFVLLAANVQFLSEHGLMAVMEGALLQLGQLAASGYFGLAMYLGFKACERVLVEQILHR